MVTETIITAATIQMIKSLVEKIISPKFEEFLKFWKIKSKELLDNHEDFCKQYFLRAYEKYSCVNTLVFHNSQRFIKDVYVTQSLVKMNWYGSDSETTVIDRFPKGLVKEYKKVLITDTAGMGKSTIMKRMFIDLIDSGLDGAGIPIYIELNRLNKSRTILQEIQDNLNSLDKEFDKRLLLRFIQTGGFVFFLDGYDEIPIADRGEVTQDIQTFISKAGADNYFILTSRPDNCLTSFGDFQSFNIRPLTEKDAYKLLTKYDLSKNKELSGSLIKLLKSGQYDTIKEFLENPLLVSLLFTAYDFNRSIPFEKHRFYGVVFEAYFEKHDNTKPLNKREKYSGLNYDDFDRILRYVGYDCSIKTGVKFNKDTILNTIRKAKGFCGISDFSENAFLEDLVLTVPLFCKDGTDFKWVHKSLMEYFAARFIFCDAKQNQDKILSAIYSSENIDKYINILDIYYDIDFLGFAKNIILPLCKSYMEFYRNNVFKSDTVESKLIEERIGLLYNMNPLLLLSAHRSIPEDLYNIAQKEEPVIVKIIKTELRYHYSEYIKPKEYRMDKEDFMIYTHSSDNGDHIGLLFHDNYKHLTNLMSLIISKKRDDSMPFTICPRLAFPERRTGIKFGEVISIDVHSGEEDIKIYETINKVLLAINTRPLFNYQACEEFKKKLERSNNDDFILLNEIR